MASLAARRKIVTPETQPGRRVVSLPGRNKPARRFKFATSFRQSFRVLKKIPR